MTLPQGTKAKIPTGVGDGARIKLTGKGAKGVLSRGTFLVGSSREVARRTRKREDRVARKAVTVVGWLITAGVHSAVWILASNAAFTSRARSKSASSDQPG